MEFVGLFYVFLLYIFFFTFEIAVYNFSDYSGAEKFISGDRNLKNEQGKNL